MSLVHEALQKAEREKQRKSGNIPLAVSSSRPVATQDFSHVPLATQAREKAAEASRPSLPPSAEPSAGPKFSQALLTMLISCVALVAIVAIVLMMNHATVGNRDAPKTTGPAEANSAAQPPQPISATSTELHPAKPSTPQSVGNGSANLPLADEEKFRVTGIMPDPAGNGRYCAIINGRVVYESFYLEGAMIKHIERDRVTLEINGRELVARLF